jgi:NADH-quinone oxidoreductase subunit L
MHTLQTLFPPTDFFLLAVILVLPLIGAAMNGVFGKRLGSEAVTLMALVTVGGSFIGAVIAFFMLKDAQQGQDAVTFMWKGWHWFSVTDQTGAAVPIDVAFSVDALSGTMALIVTGVGFLIHLYSVKYMEGDPGYHRYFSYLNLFIFSMLVLILGNSLPILFIGWEGVGLCSYLLIGFWFENDKNAAAGKKAFIANRIGDFGLLVGMMLLVYYSGALDWSGIQGSADNLLTSVQIWPIGPHVPLASFLAHHHMTGAADWLNRPRHVSVATLVGLSLFLGCAGKSAQIPLYVWLPDAMAGPTPVSALIHAATMVTAGVYLVCRMAPVFVLSPAAMFTVAFIGACTAFFAATIAIVQNDIKKVLAYSTVSQLGYMFMGVGVGAFTAGFFHVITHAFFKAGLFLGAGSVIHAMHKRIHDHDASQDMRNTGGLKRFMPITFWTFIAFTAAIVALPGTAGFFSKDEILFRAYTDSIASPVPGGVLGSGPSQITLFQWPDWGPTFLYVVGVAAALLTAFYMVRLVIGMFGGEFKGWTVVRNWRPPEHEAHGEHDATHGELLDGPEPAETPWQMTLPLVVLGLLSIFGGLFDANTPWGHFTPLDHFLDPVFASSTAQHVAVKSGAEAMAGWLLVPGVGVFLVGVGIAYWVYLMKGGEPSRALRERFPRLYALVYDKWRIDELYEETILGAVDSLAEAFAWLDRWVVDGIIARVTSFIVAVCGNALRYLQTGRVQAYAFAMVIGAGGLGWYLVAPHPNATVTGDNQTGAYTVTAAPGLGYEYRWDQNGDGKWDTKFGDQQTLQVHLGVGKTENVRLQVKNAFGRVATQRFRVHRPRPDLSGPAADTYIDQQTGQVLKHAHETNAAIEQLRRALQMGGGQK